MTYNFWIGLEKTFKNLFVVGILPGVEYAIQNVAQWNVSGPYQAGISVTLAAVGYFLKNYLDNKTPKAVNAPVSIVQPVQPVEPVQNPA